MHNVKMKDLTIKKAEEEEKEEDMESGGESDLWMKDNYSKLKQTIFAKESSKGIAMQRASNSLAICRAASAVSV